MDRNLETDGPGKLPFEVGASFGRTRQEREYQLVKASSEHQRGRAVPRPWSSALKKCFLGITDPEFTHTTLQTSSAWPCGPRPRHIMSRHEDERVRYQRRFGSRLVGKLSRCSARSQGERQKHRYGGSLIPSTRRQRGRHTVGNSTQTKSATTIYCARPV